jgi:F-type H+-transporting ATPase subunit b
MRPARTTLALLSASAAALVALPLWAAESGEVKPGLPQLDTSLFPEQLFWLAVSFVTLYLLMVFVALPGVRRTQDKRQTTIAAELAAATKANEQAKATIAQYEKTLADARAKAHATVNEIKAQAAKLAANKQTAQQKELAARLHEAEAKIRKARDEAIRDAQKNAADLANTIVEKITGVKIQAHS